MDAVDNLTAYNTRIELFAAADSRLPFCVLRRRLHAPA